MTRFICIVLLVVLGWGCAPMREASLEEYRTSLHQIDKGTISLREGKLDEAKAAFKVSLDLTPSAAAYDGLGCVALMEGNVQEAEDFLWKAYNMDNEYDHVLGNLAQLYEAKGEHQLAGKFYRAAIESNPGQFRFRNNYAAYIWDFESNRTDPAEALAELRRARSLSDDELIQQNIVRLEEMKDHG